MIVSIEIPVVKGGWLIPCIESVLHQTSSDWRLSLLWDGGDELSRSILQRVERLGHPRLRVYYQERTGIAASRRFLTAASAEALILPVDDDDLLAPTAVEELLAAAQAMPWSGIVRARRDFIDEAGRRVPMADWFPFEPRHFDRGMTTDLYNHSHPYLIRRSAYDKTAGWRGFTDFQLAGEDCDIFLQIEEVATIELLDRCLYSYRLHPRRASNQLGPAAAEEMWRRLADQTLARRGLPLARVNEIQPFQYRGVPRPRPGLPEIDCVVPFWESDREELPYELSRPSSQRHESLCFPTVGNPFLQELDDTGFDQLALAVSAAGPVSGALRVEVHRDSCGSPAVAEQRISLDRPVMKFLHFDLQPPAGPLRRVRLAVSFQPDAASRDALGLHVFTVGDDGQALLMRLFRRSPGFSRRQLERCLRSLRRAGVDGEALHVVAERQSSAANKNEGLRRSSRPLVCFVDDDVEILRPGVFDELLAGLERRAADLAGPKIVDRAGRIFCADPFFDGDFFPKPRGLGEEDGGQYDYSAEVPWLPSTFLLVRREVCRSVGGFDEAYRGSQMEDVDFCLKARRLGFRCRYVGETEVTHLNQQRNDRFSENFRIFFQRWGRQGERLRGLAPTGERGGEP
ncbi:MAG TPA: glycosyltransferase [Thermoanaerobaculia bacterium]